MADRDTDQYTMAEVADMIRSDGRLWGYWSSIVCLAVCWAESGGNAFARPVVINPSSPAHLSLDVGLMQMNTYWQPDHALPDLLTPAYNMSAAITLALTSGADPKPWRPNWVLWHAFTSYSWITYFGAAREAINSVRTAHGEPAL